MNQDRISKKELCRRLLYARIGEARWVGINHVDVSGLDLSHLDIRNIVFTNVNFSHVNLGLASMQYAIFRNCTFTYASMELASLEETTFVDCDLRYANIGHTTANNSRFRRCDLTGARFAAANINNAGFDCSNLDHADFNSAQMYQADLDDAFGTNTIKNGIPLVCPEKGGFTAYKQCIEKTSCKEYVVELYIPARAKRGSGTSRKCRASEAKVMGFYEKTGKKLSAKEVDKLKIVSHHDNRFEYKIGETVVPEHPFDENRWRECSSGIHFFLTFEEAARY